MCPGLPISRPSRAPPNRRPIRESKSDRLRAANGEKPDIETAKKFVEDGSYLWNTGTFIFKAVTFLGAIRRLAKGIYGPMKDIRKIEEKYDMLPNISVDYAIMEKAYEIYCVKGSYKWEDIGSFDSLKKVLKAEGRRFLERDGKVTKII